MKDQAFKVIRAKCANDQLALALYAMLATHFAEGWESIVSCLLDGEIVNDQQITELFLELY